MDEDLRLYDRQRGVTMLAAEVVVAALFVLAGVLVIVDSLRVGIGWADDGPMPGYFPFYVGLMLVGSGVANVLTALRRRIAGAQSFATRAQLAQVAEVFLPTAAMVALTAWLGLYVSAILFIAWFMRRHGRFGWLATAAIAIGVPLVLFLVFERWFLVPLPKGPVEALFGF